MSDEELANLKDHEAILKAILDLAGAQRGIVLMVAKAKFEHYALLNHLMRKGYLSNEDFKQLEAEVAERMKPFEREADTARLLDLLRKFEGPVH